MAFFKKSSDPWDIDPEKRKKEREKEARRAEWTSAAEPENAEPFKWPWEKSAEEETAARLQSEKCPWCGKEMEPGYLFAPDSRMYWQTERPKPYTMISKDALVVEEKGGGRPRYKQTWYCRTCRKMSFDAADLDVSEVFQKNPFFEYVDQWKAMEEREAAKKKEE